jgi:hypothetical protein
MKIPHSQTEPTHRSTTQNHYAALQEARKEMVADKVTI